MFKKSKREPAVSPVIGTILLVAITVALIAIITAVVMGLADAEDGKKVGMNAQPASGTDAKLILYGGESLSELVKLEMIDHDSPNGKYVEFWNSSEEIQIGFPYLAKGVAQPPGEMAVYDTRINVKGTFTDGREVVLLVQPMTFYDVGVTSDFEKYVGSVFFQGEDITHNKLTTGFSASNPGIGNPGILKYGISIAGSPIKVILANPFPREKVKILKLSWESITPGYAEMKESTGADLSGSIYLSDNLDGAVYTHSAHQFASCGVKDINPAQWRITIDVIGHGGNLNGPIIASKSWDIEATYSP